MKVGDVGVEEGVEVTWQSSIDNFELFGPLRGCVVYAMNEGPCIGEELVDKSLPPLHIVRIRVSNIFS